MNDDAIRRQVHDLDVTVWVGKSGISSVVEELVDQLNDRELVKVKFLRSARGSADITDIAHELAQSAEAELIETRGHTAVYRSRRN